MDLKHSSDSEEEPGYSSTKPRPISQLPDYASVDITQKTPKSGSGSPAKVTHTKPSLPPPKPPARKFITEPKPPPQLPPRVAVTSPVVMATGDYVTSPLATTSAATGFESVQDYVSIEEIDRRAANEQGGASSPDMYVSHDEVPQTTRVAIATENFQRAKATVEATPSFVSRKGAMKTKKGSSLDQVYGTQSVQGAVYTPETTIYSNTEENNESKPSILPRAPPMPSRPAPAPPGLSARAPPPTPCTPPNQCENYSDQQIVAPSTSTTTQSQNIPRLNTGFLNELAQKLQRSANVTMETSVNNGVAMETVTIEKDTNYQETAKLSADKIENFQQKEPLYDEPYLGICDSDDEVPIYRPWVTSEPEKADPPDQQNTDPPDYDTWEPDPEYLELEDEEEQDRRYENASGCGDDDSLYAEVPSPYEEECDDGIYVDPNDLDSDHSTEYEASWGSSEFDSYSDDEEDEKNVKEILNKEREKQRKLDRSLSITKQGQKVLSKFKNWQARRKSSVKEEELTFIEVQINDEKHPPPCLPPEPDNLSDNQRLRRQIVECILESENNYVSSLQRIVWEYEYALSDCNPPLISQNKCYIIFYKVRHLLQMHYQFRIALSDVVRTWDQDEMIGQSFTASFSKGMVVDIYSDFVNNFSLATELVKRCARNKPPFAQFLKERQASPDKLSLFGLMVKPIQRFPQFILLMQLCGMSVTGLGSTIRALVLQIPVALVKIASEQAVTVYKKDYSMLQAGIEYVSSAATGLIAFGLMMIVASMFGLYGACCDSPCLLYLFLPVMAILAATDVIVGVLILVGRMKIVTWFGDVTDCDACESLVKYLTSFAVPAAGLTLFSALPKIFAIYCAWRILQNMKECHEDKKLMRNFLRGRPQAPAPQQNSQQPIFILAGGAQQPIQNNINNIIQPGYMPMQPVQQQNAMGMQQQQMGMQQMGSQHNIMQQPMGQQQNNMMHGGQQQMQQQPMMQQQHMMDSQYLQPQQQPRMQQQSTFTPELLPKNQQSSKLGSKKDSKKKLPKTPVSEIPPPPPPPPDLLKQTCTDHPDRFNLQVALTELDNLAHKLNDRKRFSSQILGASQLFKNMDVRHVRRQSEAAPLLIRQDDITETHCTGQNQTPRWKPLRLHLLNDTLLCTHPLIKSGKSGTEERHRLKWSVPLSSVTIKDSVITPDTSVVLKGQPGQIVITSTRPPRGMESSLYSELDGLIHDFTVITQVSSLVSSLKRSYQELSEDSLQSLTRSIQLRIQTLDEHLRTMDSTSLQLLIKSKQGKRHVIVDFGSAEVKRKWLQDLKMQEIACLPSNKPSWLDSHLTSKQSPLYMTQLNLNITNEMSQMLCGAPFSLSAAWGPSASRQYLWLCGYSDQQAETAAPIPGAAAAPPAAKGGTSVVIVALDAHNMPNVMESFRLCKERVRCCLVVSGVSHGTGTTSRRTKHVDTVWMATDNKTIRIHALSESSRQKAVCVVELSENVTSMVRVDQWVVAATDTGLVRLLDAGHTGDSWRLLCSERSCTVSERSVDCLCWDGEEIWCGAGRRVVTVEPAGFQVKRELSVNHSADVHYLARSGVGLFVGFASRAQLQLYHAETLQHLQDINLASTLRDRIEPTGSEQAHITALSVIEHWLWIGTSIGCVLLLPLPRVQGVPLISSRALVSRHSHSSPVRFILQANQQPGPKTISDPHPANQDCSSTEPDPRTDFLTESTSNLQKSRSMNDLDTIEPSETDRIKLLYSNLFGPKSEDLDQVLTDQLSASDTHAKTGLSTMPALSFRSEFSESSDVSNSSSKDVLKKVCDDFMMVLAGGEGYIDREKKIGLECGPNIQIWCSKG